MLIILNATRCTAAHLKDGYGIGETPGSRPKIMQMDGKCIFLGGSAKAENRCRFPLEFGGIWILSVHDAQNMVQR